jgi:hypothetical protein
MSRRVNVQYCKAPTTCLYLVGSIRAVPSNLDNLAPEVQGDFKGLAPIMWTLCNKSEIYLAWHRCKPEAVQVA